MESKQCKETSTARVVKKKCEDGVGRQLTRYSELKAYVRQLLRPEIRRFEGTSDVVQHALQELVKASRHWSDDVAIWAYLRGIVRVRVLNIVREYMRLPPRVRPDESRSTAIWDLDARFSDSVLANACRDDILGHLTEKQRRLVELMEAGYTQEEIAQEFRCSGRNVRRFIRGIQMKLEALQLLPTGPSTPQRHLGFRSAKPRKKKHP